TFPNQPRLLWAHLDSTTNWRLESRQNPHAGKRALRSAAFPGCGFAELSSSAKGARLGRTLVGVSRCARLLLHAPIMLAEQGGFRYLEAVPQNYENRIHRLRE